MKLIGTGIICEKMTNRRSLAATKSPLSQSTKRNVESCPNSFILNTDSREKEYVRQKRNRKIGSSPVLETCQENSTSQLFMFKGRPTADTTDLSPQMKENQQATPIGTRQYRSVMGGLKESSLQRYTLMSYSSGQMVSSLYPNCTASLPFLPHFSSYPIHSPEGADDPEASYNIFESTRKTLFQGGHTFPSFFNPRTASNMPHKEKVNSWIENIPIYEIEEGFWGTECYDVDYSLNWEESEFDQPDLNVKDVISYATYDEILFLQARKFETLIRRLYESENEKKTNEKDLSLGTNSMTDYM